MADPYSAFAAHRSGAKLRGIGFEFTFLEWWALWEARFHLRGQGDDALCMGRYGDVGPYSVENVYITTNRQNREDYWLSAKRAERAAAHRSAKVTEILTLAAVANAKHGPHLPVDRLLMHRAERAKEQSET